MRRVAKETQQAQQALRLKLQGLNDCEQLMEAARVDAAAAQSAALEAAKAEAAAAKSAVVAAPRHVRYTSDCGEQSETCSGQLNHGCGPKHNDNGCVHGLFCNVETCHEPCLDTPARLGSSVERANGKCNYLPCEVSWLFDEGSPIPSPECRVQHECPLDPAVQHLQRAESMWWRFKEIIGVIKYPGWWPTYHALTGHDTPAGSNEEQIEVNGVGYRIFDNNWRAYVQPPKIGTRPWLGLVQTTTPMWTHSYGLMMNTVMCYAAMHGYNYNVDPFEIQTDRFVSQGRARSWLKYLPFYDWIWHLSSDMFIVNQTKSIEELGILNRGHEVVLSLRNWWTGWQENRKTRDGGDTLPFGMHRQLSTETFFIKNTDFGRKFLGEMLALQDGGKGHSSEGAFVWDMGDLHAATINAIFPESVADSCNWFYDGFRNGTLDHAWLGEYTEQHKSEMPYMPMSPLDFYWWTISVGECHEILEPTDFGKLAIYPEGAFVRDWMMGGNPSAECGHPDNSKCGGLLRCTDFLFHTKHHVVYPSYRKEDVYCLPREEDNPFVAMELSEEDSAIVAKTVNAHATNKGSGTYRGCGQPEPDQLPQSSKFVMPG